MEKLIELEKDEWATRFLQLTHTNLTLISHTMSQIFDYDVMCHEEFLQ